MGFDCLKVRVTRPVACVGFTLLEVPICGWCFCTVTEDLGDKFPEVRATLPPETACVLLDADGGVFRTGAFLSFRKGGEGRVCDAGTFARCALPIVRLTDATVRRPELFPPDILLEETPVGGVPRRGLCVDEYAVSTGEPYVILLAAVALVADAVVGRDSRSATGTCPGFLDEIVRPAVAGTARLLGASLRSVEAGVFSTVTSIGTVCSTFDLSFVGTDTS